MAHIDDIRNFAQGGMDDDSAPEFVLPNDYRSSFNTRNTGTSRGEAGYITNIESTQPVTETTPVPSGINKGIGGVGFEDTKQGFIFRYNSAGNNQILLYDYVTDTVKTIYTDLTDSGGVPLLPLDPKFYVDSILMFNQEYLVWTDGQSSIGFVNFKTLASGGYGTVLAEDLSLIKPQNLIPISAKYASDAGKAANFIKGNLFQFTSQWVGIEFTYSAWATRSKRAIPDEENTPDIGTNVRANNCIIVTVDIGSIRVKTINIAARSANFNYGTIKSIDRATILLIPDTEIDIENEIYEAYDPTTNSYSFVFYNDTIIIPIAPTETDLEYDRVPLSANAAENINGNIISLSGLVEGYDRPTTSIVMASVGYNPNITVPLNTEPNPIHVSYTFPGSSGSGAGDHKRIMQVEYAGVPHTGDILTIITSDIRNSSATQTYTYTVPSGLDGNLEQVVRSFGQVIPYSGIYTRDGGVTWLIQFIGIPYYGLQSTPIQLHNPGASISRSIHAILDNSSYQLALSYRDTYGRFFPLRTDNSFIVKTQSYAQLNGNTPKITWTISDAAAPKDAVDYQILITENATVSTMVETLAVVINYISAWNAHGNTPTLAPNSGTIGDTYQITTPSLVDDHRNLGNGELEFKTGDFVVYNGQSWDIVPKSFGDMTDVGNLMVFKINSLTLFNEQYGNEGIDTVLSYDFVPGDRCTLHYYIDGGTKNYFNDPCINVQVLGYDSGASLVKMELSSDLDTDDIQGKDVFLRLYSPKAIVQADSSVQNETIWYEIGERFTITDGKHDTLTGEITDGDVYFKTRVFQGAVDPNTPIEVLATDFNFSDFYVSNFTSYGRPRTYSDELERTERKAITRYSQNYVLGSKNNGLTKFFAETIYGEADGQTSSSFGAIQFTKQRGNFLIVGQERNVGYVGINLAILEDAIQQKQYAISEKLFNNIRYNETGDIGLGTAKESFWFYDNFGGFIDPDRSLPMSINLSGMDDMSGKMSKFFKQTIHDAYAQGKKLVMYYDRYYKEVVFSTETDSGSVTPIPFDGLNWDIYEDYEILPADITPANGAHSTVSYDDTSGVGTYTPTTDYVGNDTPIITFDVDGSDVTKNVCLNWIAGDTDINPFTFTPLLNQPKSTLESSNIILITGNNIAVPISITGGEYSINGGAWSSSSGMINANDSVQIRQTSSASDSTTTTATLTVSSYSADFDVTTGTIIVNPFSFTPQTGIAPNTDVISNSITVVGNTLPSPIHLAMGSLGSYSVNGGAFVTSDGFVNAGDTVRLKLTSSGSYDTELDSTLIIDGQNGTFAVTTVANIGNERQSEVFVKNDCATGYSGTPVEYVVDADTYFAPTLAEANDEALADIAANGQTYANDNGTCVQDAQIATLFMDFYDNSTAYLCMYCETTGVGISDIPVSATELLYPNDGSAPSICYLASSQRLTQTTLKYRAGINIGLFIRDYPLITDFDFILRGNGSTATTSRGVWVLKAANQGKLIQSIDEDGHIVPTTDNVNDSGIMSWTSNIVSGADGTTGVTVGMPILKLSYNVGTNTVTPTTY